MIDWMKIKSRILLALIIVAPSICFFGGYQTGFIHKDKAVEIIQLQRKKIKDRDTHIDALEQVIRECTSTLLRCIYH